MHKFLTKIATLSVGLAMAVGVGVAVGSKAAKVSAAESTVSWTATASANLGAAISSQGGTDTGSVSLTGADTFTLNYTRSLVWLKSGKSDYIAFQGSTWIQLGSSNSLESLEFTTSAIPGKIKSVSVATATAGTHKITVDVGGTKYLNAADLTTYSGTVNATNPDPTSCVVTGTGTSTGALTITIASAATTTGKAMVIKSVSVTYEETSGKTIQIKNNSHAVGPFEATYGDTSEYKYALAWDVDGNTAINSDCSWDVSDDSIIDYYVDGYTWLNWKPKNVGTTTITVSHEGFDSASTTITVVPGTLSSITVSGSMSKTSYYVGEDWDASGLVATGTYDSGYEADLTSDVAWTFSPASPALGVDSVVATATLSAVSGNSASQSVSVSRTNPIQVLYTKASGASVDVYGYYVGFLDGTGPVIMDGEYGIVIYDKTADVSGYTTGETILHVTGSISIYKGLYEIASPSISVASGTFDVPSKPVVYSTQGGETADKASRLTTVTGTPTVTSGSFDDDAGTNDIKMNFTVGTKTVQVFYKKAAQTADAEAFAAIKAAATASPAQEITIKGFTGWYDGFQVQMNGYVPASEDYTAEDFSQDLLDQTDAVCAGYVSDESKFAEIKTALVAIWSDLASSDKYPSLPSAEKTILAEAERKESGTVVEQAMARYDFLTGKYDLNNFINGRTPIVPAGAPAINADNTLGSSSVITIIVIASLLSVSTIGVCFIIRRRKMY